jgi:hypothetical protein
MNDKEAVLTYFVDIPASSLIKKENNGKDLRCLWPALELATSRPLREYPRHGRTVHVLVIYVAVLFRIYIYM